MKLKTFYFLLMTSTAMLLFYELYQNFFTSRYVHFHYVDFCVYVCREK